MTRHGISMDAMHDPPYIDQPLNTPPAPLVYKPPIRCLCQWSCDKPASQQALWMAETNGEIAGLLLEAILHLDAQLPKGNRRLGPCCDTHSKLGCCDPNDCGPCCENCPTCPSLHKDWLDQLAHAERELLARATLHIITDPRVWVADELERGRIQRRWMLIAHAIDSNHPLPKQETT